MEITQSKFEHLKGDAQRLSLNYPLDALGDFYHIEDGKVLFQGKEYWAANRFFLLSSLRDLISYDGELERFIPERETNEKPLAKPSPSTHREVYLNLEFTGQEVSNLDALLKEISAELNIELVNLDFSVPSLDLIDAALTSNAQADRYRLLAPFIAYVFMVIKRENNDALLKPEDFVLITKSGQAAANLGTYVIDFVLQADYNPSLWMVYNLVKRDLERQ